MNVVAIFTVKGKIAACVSSDMQVDCDSLTRPNMANRTKMLLIRKLVADNPEATFRMTILGSERAKFRAHIMHAMHDEDFKSIKQR